MKYSIPLLPLSIEIETRSVLKKLTKAHQALAELKGVSGIFPNQSILINTLSLQEAKDSSAIENIITTHDELFQSDIIKKDFTSYAAKEVYSYASALKNGYEKVKKTGLLINNNILEIHETLEASSIGFRKTPGTVLKNDLTDEIVYTPPQEENEIRLFMDNLEKFINDDSLSDVDPLIKMAIIHHQFESIHPFYDGNGRTGRIINILYLVKQNLLDFPILYLSRYINKSKNEYYRLLQAVRETQAWEEWVLYILSGVEQTSNQTVILIQNMRKLMLQYKNTLREKLPKIYSQDLLNNLFRHPYTKVDFVTSELGIHRNTALKYLDEIVNIGLLTKHKIKNENFYLNTALFDLLANSSI
ncbi:MAG: Fic family protein [Parachlamydiales bacterium]|jgi:Fic family protein